MELKYAKSNDLDNYLYFCIYGKGTATVTFMRKSKSGITKIVKLNEWAYLPIKLNQIDPSCKLKIEPKDANLIYYCNLFEQNIILKTGKHILGRECSAISEVDIKLKMYERNELTKDEWLDSLVFPEIYKIVHVQAREGELEIDFPLYEVPILYEQRQIKYPCMKIDDLVDNVVEAKHKKLARGGIERFGPFDRDLIPNAKIRNELMKIINYPLIQDLDEHEQNLIWRFRYFLKKNKQAMPKFLKCVIWKDHLEVKQALELMRMWDPIDMEDLLELFSSRISAVRNYAVEQLSRFNDEELELFLPQLVQAMKFESEDEIKSNQLVHYFIQRAAINLRISNYLFWALKSGGQNKYFRSVLAYLIINLTQHEEGRFHCDILERQSKLILQLNNLVSKIKSIRLVRVKKVEWLRSYIEDPANELNNFKPIPFPLDPNFLINGINHETASIFKSSLAPLMLEFKTVSGYRYPVMFKLGDDLRQDQLVVQLIHLMDRILKNENLDLKFTVYKVLSTGDREGMMEFIPSKTLANILAEYNGNLQNYLKSLHPCDDPETFNIEPTILETYIKSCAGYCIVTYLLGVGDRHLENLLLTSQGNLFHVDFGFILGKDPKPFPPPMKLCKEMVEAMGGQSSFHYVQFKSYCYLAFSILRKRSNLILNIFNLMLDSGIQDISLDKEFILERLHEKFRLDLSEEEAMNFIENTIQESVKALFPQMMEKIHQWAQYWRR
ncbi:phosphatidylinositol 3-kinase [Rozella allomycis CSF55]|uniref:Phosphatidylinositol 3-kinase VPS34 n=1 Tax=Rozella allomycis (strain CSF55) TaxID=988480 RepID=A0A075B2W0_ROZAC|nr:Phosphatidylinositol Kinase domain-containing protein [Rozella allomycis CSF55]RKP21505.1 phosphatidylinositol 3-kinase [Rozella allomycis CSF55]|eukprot:EPZ35311.1 Phosphatidylinositol Kinase domain-containing protein [Rozella allomycis CSF55]